MLELHEGHLQVITGALINTAYCYVLRLELDILKIPLIGRSSVQGCTVEFRGQVLEKYSLYRPDDVLAKRGSNVEDNEANCSLRHTSSSSRTLCVEALLLAERMHLESPNRALRVVWFHNVYDLIKELNCPFSHCKAFGEKNRFLCNSLREEIGKRLLSLSWDSCKEQYVTESN